MKRILNVVFWGALLSCWPFHLCGFAGEDLLPRLANKYENVRVERVIKSDLIVLEDGKKIHLIGLKAFDKPRFKEVQRDEHGFIIEDTSDPTTSIEDQAYEFANRLMSQKKIRVEFDTKTVDEDGDTWGYVFLADGTMANAEILRQGLAELQIRFPNVKYAEQLRQAYRESHREKRGIQAE